MNEQPTVAEEFVRSQVESALGWVRIRDLNDLDSLEAYRVFMVLEELVGCTLPEDLIYENRSWSELASSIVPYLSSDLSKHLGDGQDRSP